MAIVYIATNIINGKRYVGVTNKALEKRRMVHYGHAFSEKRNTKFAAAIRKYGRDSFSWTVLAEYRMWKDALAGEVHFIKRLKPEYNLTDGGEGTVGHISHNRRKVLCLDDGILYASVTEAAKAKGLTCGSLVGAMKKGKSYRAAGKFFIYSTKILSKVKRKSLISQLTQEQVKRRRRAPVRKNVEPIKKACHVASGRKVLCVEDGKVFESASAAARYYSSAKSAIIELCLGKNGRKTVNGRRFTYYIGPLKKAA